MPSELDIHWYALKVFFNKVFEIEDILKGDGTESYIPCETVSVVSGGVRRTERRTLVPSLMFFRSDERYASNLQAKLRGRVMLYTYLDNEKKRYPAAISDHEMKMFILVTSSGDNGLSFYSDENVVYKVGEHVRVIGGIFKGAEGYVKRIKHNRCLTVTLKGICMVATSFIDPRLLEKID